MQRKKSFLLLLVIILASLLSPFEASPVQAEANEKPLMQVSPSQLIAAMNVLRMSYGLAPLIENATINSVAQSTAQIMADQQLSWHIGDVAGRISAAGYGAGAKVYATENFAYAAGGTIDQIMLMWADYDHMRPATQPNYCHVGAGAATDSRGFTYYILQAAYISGAACDSTPPTGGGSTGEGSTGWGIVTPVEKVEADKDGNYIHEVKTGQSLWAIAVAYGVTINDILAWNNLASNYVLWPGDKLIIKGPNSSGLATPTKLGSVVRATPDENGRIVHEVQAYQYLFTIAEAYGVPLATILELNYLQENSTLSIGQNIIIKGPDQTATPTPLPLTPLQRLTPGADGKYYHAVADGQNLEWIANLYGISLNDLMSWNYLTASSVIYPGQLLFLDVTPPPTLTPTQAPPTETPTPSPTFTPSPSPTLTLALSLSPTSDESSDQKTSASSYNWLWLLALAAVAVAGYFVYSSQKAKKANSKPEAPESQDPQDK